MCRASSAGTMWDIGMVHTMMRWNSSASIRMSLLAVDLFEATVQVPKRGDVRGAGSEPRVIR